METADHLARLRLEADALALAAAAGPLDVAVPGCPEWDLEALVRHIGDVHRWAAKIVREQPRERLRRDFEGPREEGALLAWYREGAAGLLAALEAAGDDDDFWFWGPAPGARAFWARRQAHETGIHRFDAESARGGGEPFPTEVALDGVDEWLGLATRRAHAPAGGGRVLHLHATDGDGEWLVRVDEALAVERGHGRGDCAVRAAASDLFLLVMNRRSPEGLEVFGDAGLLDVWAGQVRF